MKPAALLFAACLTGAARAQCEPQWTTVATVAGGAPGIELSIRAIAAFNGEVVVGGSFTSIAGHDITSLAASSDGGLTWHSLAGGVTVSDNSPGDIRALLVRPEGLYAAGYFDFIGGVPLAAIARWDGLQWHPLDQGLVWDIFRGTGEVLFEYGNQVVVGGYFFLIGETRANHICRWNLSAWNYFDPEPTPSHGVGTATPWAGGIAAALQATPGSNVVHWDGDQWNQLPNTPYPETLIGYDGNLYAGAFSSTGQRCVVRLKGGAWVETAPFPFVAPPTGCRVYDLHIHNGELYAGGTFRTAAGTGPERVARWDGTAWLPVGTGPGATVRVLATVNGELWAGGSGRISRYACACYANCDASTTTPVLTANDFVCFVNQFALESTYANCDGSTGDPALTGNDFICFVNRYANGCS